jgi:hypothetical protein
MTDPTLASPDPVAPWMSAHQSWLFNRRTSRHGPALASQQDGKLQSNSSEATSDHLSSCHNQERTSAGRRVCRAWKPVRVHETSERSIKHHRWVRAWRSCTYGLTGKMD